MKKTDNRAIIHELHDTGETTLATDSSSLNVRLVTVPCLGVGDGV